jgi:hypothetical protein
MVILSLQGDFTLAVSAGETGGHEVILLLKQRSMDHMKAFMSQPTAANTSEQAAAAEAEEVDMMEEPADVEVEDDDIQKLASKLGSGKRSRSGSRPKPAKARQ